ncbi:hypothetical protein AOLI_G00276120 [Acnodon oligacanthus]
MLAGIKHWSGEAVPDIVGIVRLHRAVSLSPGHEHNVWAKLPENHGFSSSTVVPGEERAWPIAFISLYNRRSKGSEIEIGDRVLGANKVKRGCHKLADRWEGCVYFAVDHNPQTHVYKIENPISGKMRVVHRNLLLGVNFLAFSCEDNEAEDLFSDFSDEDEES